MKRLTAEDLLNLKYGDKVYLRQKSYSTPYRFVGLMPSSKRYIILSCGQNLKHLYIREDGTFIGEWFGGKFDEKVLIQLEIETLEKELQSLKNELLRP